MPKNNNRMSMQDTLKQMLETKPTKDDLSKLARSLVIIFSIILALSVTMVIWGFIR